MTTTTFSSWTQGNNGQADSGTLTLHFEHGHHTIRLPSFAVAHNLSSAIQREIEFQKRRARGVMKCELIQSLERVAP